MEGFVGLLVLGLVLAIYFAPSLVAHDRQHPNRAAIVALNLLLGWTVLGWVGALVWALTNAAAAGPVHRPEASRPVVVPRPLPVGERVCPACRSFLDGSARFCPSCGTQLEPVRAVR